MQEGYVTIATGKRVYLDLALNLALSTKINDSAPICLITDNSMEIPDNYGPYFDRVVRIDEKELLVGCSNKLLIYDYAPFEENLYVDSDCLLMKREMSFFWKSLRNYDVTVQGIKRTQGTWGPKRIEDFLQAFRLDYLIQANSGVVYFRKSDLARKVFARSRQLFDTSRSKVSWPFKDQPGQFADEPILCTAISEARIPQLGNDLNGKSLMFSSVGASDFHLDVFAGNCRFHKGKNRRSYVSPQIFHFCELNPYAEYIREVGKLRRYFSLDPFEHVPPSTWKKNFDRVFRRLKNRIGRS